jgi:hypothetical protein
VFWKKMFASYQNRFLEKIWQKQFEGFWMSQKLQLKLKYPSYYNDCEATVKAEEMYLEIPLNYLQRDFL